MIYQAGAWARLERVERVRRKGENTLLGRPGSSAPGPEYVDPDHPWNWSFRALCEDGGFWKRELEEPAILVLSRVADMTSVLGGDAPVGRVSPAASSGQTQAQPPPHQHTREPPSRRQAPAGRERVHQVGSNGLLACNRSGNKLCEDFQHGRCAPSLRGGSCPKDAALRHQCAKCLSPDHGSDECKKPVAGAPSRPAKGSGKGKKGRRPQF